MPDVTVRLKTNGGNAAEIEISLTEDAYRLVEHIAQKRGKSIEDVVIEALRLEKMLADRELYIRDGARVRELQSA
jgi:hypothetical protein